MKLKKLKIENYGIFKNKEFSFPDNNLVILYGPNEAGKTTFLNSVRESFFGFKSRMNPYQFYDADMTSEVVIKLKDGKEVHYRRTKSRKSPVIGEIDGTGLKFDDNRLLQLFGNINSDIYWNIFGFSLSELTQGEEGLKNKEITEVLYSSGMGGVTNIEEINSLISAEESELYKPSGRNPILNHLLQRIKEKEKEMREHIIPPSNYANILREMKSNETKKEELKEKLDETSRRLNHIELLLDSRDSFIDLKNNQESLGNMALPTNLPLKLKESYTEPNNELKRLKQELLDLETEILSIKKKRNAITYNQALLEEKPAIETLFSEVKIIESCHRDIPLITNKSNTLRNGILEELKSIDDAWDIEFIKSFKPDISDKTEFEGLVELYRILEKKIDRVSDYIKNKKITYDNIKNKLKKEERIKDFSKQEILLEKARDYITNKEEYNRLLNDKNKNDKKKKTIWLKLSPLIKEGQNIDFSIPLDNTIDRFEKDISNKKAVLDRYKNDLELQQKQLDEEEEELNSLIELKVPIDRDCLLEKRTYRDLGWNIIKTKYINESGKVTKNNIKEWMGDRHSNLPIAYEEAVKDSDQISDQLYTNSEMITKKEDLEKRRTKQQKLLTDTTKRIVQAEKELNELYSNWNEQWSVCGFEPLSPNEMKEWVSRYKELLTLLDEEAIKLDQIDRLNEKIISFFTEAKTHFSNVNEKNVNEIMKKLSKDVHSSRESKTRITQYKQDLEEIKIDIEKKSEEKKDKESEMNNWKRRWTSLMKNIGFHIDWNINLAEKVLRILDNAKQKLNEDEENQVRLGRMKTAVDNHLKAAKALSKRINWKRFDEKNPEKTVKELYGLVAEEQKKEQSWIQLTDKLNDKTFEKTKKEKEYETNQNIIKDLFKTGGVVNNDEFLDLISRVETVNKLQNQIEKNTEYLNRLRRKEKLSLDDLLQELEETDFTSIELEKDELLSEKKRLNEQWEEDFREFVTIEEKFKKFNGSSKAAEIANEVEFLRADFDTCMDRYISLVLARRLLEEAVKRFEQEHQPELLNIINDLFKQITSGEYTHIKTSLDKENPFRVVTKDGKEKTPNQLSRGTREQLYLAIRLGYIEHYSKKSEPLPIIMDDVMVNFDGKRAENTAKTIVDLSKDKQIIFMTCHENTIKKFQKNKAPISILKL